MIKKKRGRKRTCDVKKEEKLSVIKDNRINFNSKNEKQDDNSIMKLGNSSLNIIVKKSNKKKNEFPKITSKHNLCEASIPEDIHEYTIVDDDNQKERCIYGIETERYKNHNYNGLELQSEVEQLDIVLKQFINKSKFPWAEQTDICCWWCCHQFECTPKILPTHYNPKTKVFKFTGVFCSWNCVRSYGLNDNSLDKPYKMELITRLLQSIYGFRVAKQFKYAPPRQALKMFGGKLSIEQFRSRSDKYEYYDINFVSAVLDCNVYFKYKFLD